MEYPDVFAIIDEKVRPERQRTSQTVATFSQAASATIGGSTRDNGLALREPSPTLTAFS